MAELPSPDACSSSLSHYRRCLQDAKAAGYAFMRMADYVSKKDALEGTKLIVLRHDIDHFLPLAVNMAAIENELGISATYFLRLHAAYNPFSFPNYGSIKKLQSMGHEIGLHHDGDFASLFGEDGGEFFRRDKAVLENILNSKVLGMSSHEPGKSAFLPGDDDLARLGLAYQAYSGHFTKELKYISDSSSRWREGCMCSFIKRGVPGLCILTHPIWWYSRSPLENY
ncbi:MAG: hypothetical protein V1798_04375 [Pseudomonadota bacterium]